MRLSTISTFDIEVVWNVKGYIYFTIPGIDGIFRVVNSEVVKGVEGAKLTRAVSRIVENKKFFKEVCFEGVEKIFDEAVGERKWDALSHPKLANNFTISPVYNQKITDSETSALMENTKVLLEKKGVKLLYSLSSYRTPEEVCYFFPNKK